MSMRLTKLEHACFMLEKSGHRMYLDPGELTTPLTECSNVVAVVITHEHRDHWTREQVARILERSPGCVVVATETVLAALTEAADAAPEALRPAIPGETLEVGPFRLRFFGGEHAEIHRSIPRVENVGVLVNDCFYDGGDAYVAPEGIPVNTLAVPAYGPWMRIADSIDYILAVKPQAVVPMHEMLLARRGKELATARLGQAADQVGGALLDLQPYDSAELDDDRAPIEDPTSRDALKPE